MNGTGIWLAGLCLCWADSVWAAGNPSDGSAYETIVRANDSATGPLATTRSADEARTLPGGFGDALRAVESAPGVARAQLGCRPCNLAPLLPSRGSTSKESSFRRCITWADCGRFSQRRW